MEEAIAVKGEEDLGRFYSIIPGSSSSIKPGQSSLEDVAAAGRRA